MTYTIYCVETLFPPWYMMPLWAEHESNGLSHTWFLSVSGPFSFEKSGCVLIKEWMLAASQLAAIPFSALRAEPTSSNLHKIKSWYIVSIFHHAELAYSLVKFRNLSILTGLFVVFETLLDHPDGHVSWVSAWSAPLDMLAIFGDGELGGSKWGWIISRNPQEIGVNILLECVVRE